MNSCTEGWRQILHSFLHGPHVKYILKHSKDKINIKRRIPVVTWRSNEGTTKEGLISTVADAVAQFSEGTRGLNIDVICSGCDSGDLPSISAGSRGPNDICVVATCKLTTVLTLPCWCWKKGMITVNYESRALSLMYAAMLLFYTKLQQIQANQL